MSQCKVEWCRSRPRPGPLGPGRPTAYCERHAVCAKAGYRPRQCRIEGCEVDLTATRRRICDAHLRVAQDRRREQTRSRQRLHASELADLKRHPCDDCGERFHPVAMDFDHRPEEMKQASVSMMKNSRERRDIEIAKCDLVCANCHRVRTWARSRFM